MKQFFSKHVFYVGNFDVVPISNQCFIFLRIKQTDQSSYLGKQFIFLEKKNQQLIFIASVTRDFNLVVSGDSVFK